MLTNIVGFLIHTYQKIHKLEVKLRLIREKHDPYDEFIYL